MPLSLNKPKLDNLAAEIWKSAERLRGKFKAYEYQNVVLPIIVIHRLECVLIKWREARRRIKPDGVRFETSADLLPHIRHYADRKQEHLFCVSVNGANEVINIRVVSIGLVDRSPAHPREVFADALMDRASAVIIAHNHPSGSLEPSPADIEVTKQLKAAGTVMGISLLDHIIFNRSGYFSFLEAGKL